MAKRLGLNYVVITSVARDDLEDGGAAGFAKTIEVIRQLNRDIKVEVLIPDFGGSVSSLKTIIDASPDVTAHNIETVKRLYKELRPQASYGVSLEVLSSIKKGNTHLTTKSSIMLGLGETEEEVLQTMEDLRYSHCDILTLGQYLAPSNKHYPVKEFISTEKFMEYKEKAYVWGFKSVLSAPLVRSSYQAEEVYQMKTQRSDSGSAH
jgi:lipoic acid synthetase